MCHQDSLEEEGSNLEDDVRNQDELGVSVSEKKKLGTAVHGLLFRLQVRLMPIQPTEPFRTGFRSTLVHLAMRNSRPVFVWRFVASSTAVLPRPIIP